MLRSTKADLMLLLTTAFWGLTFPIMSTIITKIDPSMFVFYRFVVASLAFLPFVWFWFGKTSKIILLTGIFLGILNSAIYLCQTTGLQTIDAPRAAFITGASVIMVPFLLPLLRMGKPLWWDTLFALTCLLGLFILTGASIHKLAVGDCWVLAGAFFNAIAIITIQWVTQKNTQYRLLAFYQIIFTLPAVLAFGAHLSIAPLLNPAVIAVILFCGIFATSLAFFIQAKYQQHTSAPKAALIYALEPVFAVIFAGLIGNAHLSAHTLVGGAIMLLSIALPDGIKLYRTKRR
jgi:drug/metabolite transporter (DMT)-like permease